MFNDDLNIRLYREMKRIRMIEEIIGEKFQEQEMKTPVHLCIGQEAIAVGVCQNLILRDVIYSNHRGHGHYLAKGGDLGRLIAELYNKEEGCSRGRGGSMHILDKAAGIGLTSSIVSGSVPLAVGEALGFKMRKEKNVAVAFLGDGASEEGSVYESICFAQVKKLPVVFVCENNLYAMHSSFGIREPMSDISGKFSNIISTNSIDGNNIFEVYKTAKAIIENARNNFEPTFLECKTYRLRNHYETKNGEPIGERNLAEFQNWFKKCPISKMEEYLENNCMLDFEQYKSNLEEEIKIEIEEAMLFAQESQLPKKEDVLNGLWA